eukprot:5755032-Prymnesium_polylepis.1
MGGASMPGGASGRGGGKGGGGLPGGLYADSPRVVLSKSSTCFSFLTSCCWRLASSSWCS